MDGFSLADVVRNPEWLPHKFEDDEQSLTFVHVPRVARAELMFLYDQYFAEQFQKASFPTAEVAIELECVVQAPIHFIFHTSLCGSSLLARAFDLPDVASTMREPAIGITLAERILQQNNSANAQRLEILVSLLARPFSLGEAVVVKHSNFANRLAAPILMSHPHSRAVLLYSDLETYLISLLKRGIWGRILGRKLFNNLRSWSTLKLDFSISEMLELTDMQVASLAWLMQISHFDTLAKNFRDRTKLLNSDKFFASLGTELHHIFEFFNLGISELAAAEIVAGPTFAKHSKSINRQYSLADRKRELLDAGSENSEEITMAVKWIESYAIHHGLPLVPSA